MINPGYGTMNRKDKDQRPLEEAVIEAVDGSRPALEEILLRIQDRLYYLALRMLSHPEDARDATQEILIKVMTRLETFRAEGPFQAWVFRIAANHLLTVRKSRMERFEISWEKAGELVDQAEARGWLSDPPAAPDRVLEIETRLRCTQALLTTMDRPHRLAFILGAVMDISSRDGAYVLDISSAAFRKRVSRAREKILAFLVTHCGLLEETNRCSCRGILANHLQNKWTNPHRPIFMKRDDQAISNETLKDCLKELDQLSRVSTLFQAYPETPCPRSVRDMIKHIMNQGSHRVLSQTPVQ